ncbi:predicted protein [Naegleria gruberi]|uniref:Predicted protein n=1 Tax=Naegleria gruberi TaxID=5762 RepID=D2VX41_NAEGR|nr:uncharacterized protein NAEGRDRAFT_73610 [Naegleria gruberi]EFC38557.1 predicted protein [Naegleria gruberi]|eukprot:XP_002671301.1 predicted protein [Naegleria gruberi strain NEG-M]
MSLEPRPILAKEVDYMKKVASVVGAVDRSLSKAGNSSSTTLTGVRKELHKHFDEEERNIAERQMKSAQISRRLKQREAIENALEKKVVRPQTSTSSFKTIERDNAPIYKGDKHNQTTPGQYDVNYSLVDRKDFTLKWVPPKVETDIIDENYKYYLEGEKLSTNDGKGTTNGFLSKTGRTENKVNFKYENEFLDTLDKYNKFKFKEDRSTIVLEKGVDRNKALELYKNKNEAQTVDLLYEVVNPDTYKPKLANGILPFDSYSDRKTARKGSKIGTALIQTDIENNTQSKLPNWSVLQHSEPNAIQQLSISKGTEKPMYERVVALDKQTGRDNMPEYKKMLWTPIAYYNKLNASEYQKKRDAEQEVERFKKDKKNGGESLSLNSEMHAYSKTHHNIPFTTYMDKQLSRPKFIVKPQPWNDLDFYDTNQIETSKNERIKNISCMPRKRKGEAQEEAIKMDDSYKFYQVDPRWGKPTHGFEKDTGRDNCKAPIIMRYTKESTDVFYDANRSQVEDRIKGDPQIKNQLPRDQNRSKLFKAQHNFQMEPNQNYETARPGYNLKKGFVEYNRSNTSRTVTSRIAVNRPPNHLADDGKNEYPTVGTYEPTFSVTEKVPVAFSFSKSGM